MKSLIRQIMKKKAKQHRDLDGNVESVLKFKENRIKYIVKEALVLQHKQRDML